MDSSQETTSTPAIDKALDLMRKRLFVAENKEDVVHPQQNKPKQSSGRFDGLAALAHRKASEAGLKRNE